MKTTHRQLEPKGLELIEEAVHLVRGAPVATLAIYYAGAVPFVLGLLFFWAHTTWFQPTGDQVAWAALGLVVLFAAMKVAQAEFCARLMATRLGTSAPPWSWARARKLAIAQMRLREHDGGRAVRQHVRQPLRGIRGIERHVRAAGLEHGE